MPLNFLSFGIIFITVIIFILAFSIIIYFLVNNKFSAEGGITDNPLYFSGKKTHQIENYKKYCYNCSKLIDKNDNYCLYCGANVKARKSDIQIEKYNKILDDANNLFKEKYFSSVVFKCGRQIIQGLLYEMIKDDEDYEKWCGENPSDNLNLESFFGRIEYLYYKKEINQKYRDRLHFIRKKSNITSHPEEADTEINERIAGKILEYTSDFLKIMI